MTDTAWTEPAQPQPAPVAQTRLVREQFDALKPVDLRPYLHQLLEEQRKQNARLKKMHFWVFWSGLVCFISLLPLMALLVLIILGGITGGIAGVVEAFR